MKIYNLYLDESHTHTRGLNEFFSISGIIVEKNYYDNQLISEIDKLKQKLWNPSLNYKDYILHEKDISFAVNPRNKSKLSEISPEYHIFQDKNITKDFYIELEKIISKHEIIIMGACISIDELKKHYHNSTVTDKSLIILQIILENFCHFLEKHNAIGEIFYESIGDEQDKKMSMRFHHIKSIGTMYIQPFAIQKLIRNIYFPNKKDNIVGLQIADFIPNNVVRKAAQKKKSDFNLYRVIERKSYDGGISKKQKYGIKNLP